MFANVCSICLNWWIISQNLDGQRRFCCALSSSGLFGFQIIVEITESRENTSSSPWDTHKNCTSLESEIWAECTHMEGIPDKGLQNTRKWMLHFSEHCLEASSALWPLQSGATSEGGTLRLHMSIYAPAEKKKARGSYYVTRMFKSQTLQLSVKNERRPLLMT
jgi:hypothetical protein